MRPDGFIGGQFEWFLGEVLTVNDPEFMNRVQVRCFGFYSDNIETANIPWATVMNPSTSGSYKGVGINHNLQIGSWVVGFFRDGPSAQDPIVLGSIASRTDDIIDNPIEAHVENNTNHVYKSQSGHLIELDNTPEGERIHIQHGVNKTAFEISPNGLTTLKSRSIPNDDDEVITHTLSMDPVANTVYIHHHSGTTINITPSGTVSINAIDDIVNIDGNTTITGTLHTTKAITSAAEITAKAGSQATDDAGNTITNEDGSAASGSVTLTGHTHVEIPGTGGSSSPTPGTAETKSPTKGT